VKWFFLSPHFDDIALSCGGLVWTLSQAGHQVEICTICSGEPPAGPLSSFAESLHQRWDTGAQAVTSRKTEDQESCTVMGAAWRYAGVPDCIYRPGGNSGAFYYDSEEQLFGELHPAEVGLAANTAAYIQSALEPGDLIVVPLALGGHVDHRLTRQAAEQVHAVMLYYADYPYLLEKKEQLDSLVRMGWQPRHFSITSDGLRAWQSAVAAHDSQISTFWADLESMKAAIKALWISNHEGVILWQPPHEEHSR